MLLELKQVLVASCHFHLKCNSPSGLVLTEVMSEDNVGPRRTQTQTTDGTHDTYDHEISLVDATVPRDSQNRSRTPSPSPAWRDLVRKPTKESVREQLARRKYAKWQQERYSSAQVGFVANKGKSREHIPEQASPTTEEGAQTTVTDFARVSSDRGRKSRRKQDGTGESDSSSVIDILYENQRGWFFFGIPLYSHSSLLNLDPAPWMTKDFKDSAVDITNAQVPDPSWIWGWKTWYVDMSYDVDEEGWQYSFSFGKKWAWHGSHPWFHSFVRRRRWLRKRTKRGDGRGEEKSGTMDAAHHLTADYFTIHSKRDRSPASLGINGTSTATPSSYEIISKTHELEENSEDIKDIPNLFKALHLAKVDREKIEAVGKFVDQGADELTYLKEKVPEILSLLVFQTSRTQLLNLLRQSAEGSQKRAASEADSQAERSRREALLSAAQAVENQINGLEYWSDPKHTLVDDSHDESGVQVDQAPRVVSEEHLANDIRGISSDAEVDVDPTLRLAQAAQQSQQRSQDKGKGKEVVNEDADSDKEDS